MSKKNTEERAQGGYVEPGNQFVVGAHEGVEVFIPVTSEPAVHIEPVKPTAQLILDKYVTDDWLHTHYKRVFNVFKSIRLEPDGVDEERIEQVIRMAVAALRSRGVLYVPASIDVKSYALPIEPVEEPQDGYFSLVKI
jgi:hypothetical protein